MAESDQKHNTLRLGERELSALLDAIEARSGAPHRNRVDTRWTFRQTAVDVTLTPISGIRTDLRLACRNISRRGIGLLHRAYVHVGTPAVVFVTRPPMRPIRIPGVVSRCAHVTGMIHEIGIRFDEEVDIRAIVQPDPMLEVSAIENVDPGSLSGVILVAEPCEVTVKLVKHYLKSTQLRVRRAKTVEEAEQIAADGVGLILCATMLGEQSATDLARRLLDHHSRVPPLLVMSAEVSQQTRGLIRHPGVAGFIAKPFSQDYLVRTIAEFYREFDAAMHGGGPGVVLDRSVIAELLPELRSLADRLEQGADAGAGQAREVLVQLAGVAPVLGLSELAIQVEALVHELSGVDEVGALADQVREVVALCRQAAGPG